MTARQKSIAKERVLKLKDCIRGEPELIRDVSVQLTSTFAFARTVREEILPYARTRGPWIVIDRRASPSATLRLLDLLAHVDNTFLTIVAKVLSRIKDALVLRTTSIDGA